jgi:predicted MFS family arabinose efflux permease
MVTRRKRSSKPVNPTRAAACSGRRGHASLTVLAAPGAPTLFASSIIARLPLAMLSISLLVHAQRLTGSFAVAGIVSGAYAIARGVGAPLLGRLVDRCGQTIVLLSTASAAALLLMVVALLPSSAPPAVLVMLAASIGLATPPLAACVRTLLPTVLSDADALPTAYAFESTALELTFILGPPLALGLAALWSTGAALTCGGFVLLAATTAFAAQPASRRWQPLPDNPRPPGGSLRSPAIRTLVLILICVGAVFGAVDVGVIATAKALGTTAAGGPLLGLWGVGSLLGCIVATRLGGGARHASGLALLLTALTLGHAALGAATGSVLAIGALLLLAGASIAPMFATIYAMVDKAAPAGTRTETFAWLSTAASTGASVGAAGAGAVAQSAGAAAVFAFAGAAGALAVLIAVLRSGTVDERVAATSALAWREA